MKKVDKLSILKWGMSFWFCVGLLIVLLVSIMGRDIDRPMYGLHSWAEAHSYWLARVQVNYGLRYTGGFMTWAVGDPPTVNPKQYLDHPQLTNLLNSAFMAILGINNWSLRVVNIIATAITLLLFLKVLRGLLDDVTVLLAGMFFCLFPVIGYFGVYMWLFPFSLWAIWNYLVLTGNIDGGPEPRRLHKILLAFCLFMMLQFSWEGFFFALGIGIHYVSRCIYRRTLPDGSLLAILIFAPLSSLALDFIIMAAGYGWDIDKIRSLVAWRGGSGEMKEHIWLDWFARFWEYAVCNFTLPVLIVVIAYLTFGQLFVSVSGQGASVISRRFPHFWLFFMPPVFQLFILKGCLWRHQTWEKPFCFLIAIAAALGVMLLGDILKKANKHLANVVMVSIVGLCVVCSVRGTNFYYGMRWQSPAKIKMLEMLRERIPPDKALLSFEDFIVNQHPAKGAFYRPEIAWHLDRDIVAARTMEEIGRQAKTGRYPYYLIPQVQELASLINQLAQHYKYEYVPGDEGELRDGKFYKAGMLPYIIFDLTSRAAGSD